MNYCKVLLVTIKSVLASNDTRWNSVYRQIEAVVELDQLRLLDVLQKTLHENLIMNAKELAQLQELVSLLTPFAEATDLNR